MKAPEKNPLFSWFQLRQRRQTAVTLTFWMLWTKIVGKNLANVQFSASLWLLVSLPISLSFLAPPFSPDSCHSLHTMEQDYYEGTDLSPVPADGERTEEFEYEVGLLIASMTSSLHNHVQLTWRQNKDLFIKQVEFFFSIKNHCDFKKKIQN